MEFIVLIAGAGQLGSRYLQGLAKCTQTLNIYVYDISQESLERAKSRWNEVLTKNTQHRVHLLKDINLIPNTADLAIISTNSLIRTELVKSLNNKCKIKYWILEKVLAQSDEQIIDLQSTLKSAKGVWVNTPYRAMEWYNKIKKQMNLGGHFVAEVRGGKTFGLACNAIHYLDLLCWFSGESLVSSRIEGLENTWFKSKRLGFWDLFGTMSLKFSNGSFAQIHGETFEPSKTTISITTENTKWIIYESDGKAVRNDGLILIGRDEYQSEIIAPIVDSILQTGACLLTPISESAAMHKVMISSLMDHWNAVMPERVNELPIT